MKTFIIIAIVLTPTITAYLIVGYQISKMSDEMKLMIVFVS